MVAINVTYLFDQVLPYSSIIGPAIGGIIAAGAGILVAKYNIDRSIEERRRVVARAFYEEISIFLDRFECLFENYNTRTFDEASSNPDDPYFIVFQNEVLHQIINLEIATYGPKGNFLQEKNPFNVFFEDIYKFNDIHTMRNVLQVYRFLATADKHYQNYCNDPNRPFTDLYKFLEITENAYAFINQEALQEDLKLKSLRRVSIWKKFLTFFKRN
jgi:hypothetical protein